MELKVAAINLGKVAKQRNLFLCFSVLLVLSNLMLSWKLSNMEERIIMVPGIREKMSITGSSVSESYLEESALLFLSCLLDLTADVIEHKRDLVLKYTSHSDPKWIADIKEYFDSSIEQHKKFKLSTYFTPKNMSIDTKNMQVVTHGILNSSFGKDGYDSKTMEYLLEFELIGGHLKLKQFKSILNIPKTFQAMDLKIRGEHPECINIHEDARFPKFSKTQSLKCEGYNDVEEDDIKKADNANSKKLW